jgi:hypothetical protein
MMREFIGMVVVLTGTCAWAKSSVDVTSFTDAQRREFAQSMPREAVAEALRNTSQERLLAMSQRVVGNANSYRYRMVKQERVGGVLLPEQTIDVFVRERPFAVRLHYVNGPAAGRKVLFNPAIRPSEFRVREGGLLSVIGAIWLDIDSAMAKADSNHDVTEAGLGSLLARLVRDFARAKSVGGFRLMAETWSAEGHPCSDYRSPPAQPAFDYVRTRVCTDLASGIPTRVEGYGHNDEVLEKWHFSDFRPHQASSDFFNWEFAQL